MDDALIDEVLRAIRRAVLALAAKQPVRNSVRAAKPMAAGSRRRKS
jgi:hypothetical protein